jgi:predicted permease
LENFILIIVCLLSGALLKKSGILPNDAHKVFNTVIIYFCLPAVALFYVPKMEIGPQVLLPFTSSFIVWFGSWAIFSFLALKFHWPRDLKSSLILLCGLGNTSFVGFPLVEAYFGAEFISIALFADQGGFLIVSTFAVFVAVKASGGAVNFKSLMANLFKFPPFIAFLLAIVLRAVEIPDWFFALNQKLAAPLVPLAMLSVGYQINFKEKFKQWGYLSLGLLYKLILAPLIVFVLFFYGLNQGDNPFAQISVFEASMAPMVTAFIIASQYNLRPNLASMMVGVGIPLSLITTYFWFLLLGN